MTAPTPTTQTVTTQPAKHSIGYRKRRQVRLVHIDSNIANIVPGGLSIDDLRAALEALELWVTEPNPPSGIPRDDLGASARLRAALDALEAGA